MPMPGNYIPPSEVVEAATGIQTADHDKYTYDSGANDTIAYWFSPEIAKNLLDKSSGIPRGRRSTPPSYHEYLKYEHRINDPAITMRIGDCELIVPPDFISVKEINNVSSTVAIRQENSLKEKSGYSRKEITITMYFNGLNQINGYEVESPFKYPYYVDGLRPLLAQFKCTPFLPVENECLNYTNNIFNIALQSITVNTVPGFPEVLQATLIAHEFNAVPYIESPDYCFDDMIDWDLFRYYYQQLMREDIITERTLKKATIMNKLDSKITVYMMDEEQFATDKDEEELDITDSLFISHITNIGDNADNFVVSEMSFGLANMLTFVQLSNHASPTMQYLGGNDTIINMTIETTDSDVASKFRILMDHTNAITRNNRQYHGLGFIKVDNEILRILGTQYVMISDCTITTVPDFPGTYSISIQCISYDMISKGREDVNGIKPFSKRDGTIDDAITQTPSGLKNKIQQDLEAEARIMELELYPDLYLPTYNEIDMAIQTITEFRYNKRLAPYHLVLTYPRKPCIHNIGGKNTTYEKFVDPDFYVFYPFEYKLLEDNNIDSLGISKPRPDAVDVTLTYETGISNNSNTDMNLNDLGTLSGYENFSKGRQAFLKVLFPEVGQGYAFGANGQVLTQEELNRLIKTYGASTKSKKWIGKRVYDCSGFVSYGLWRIGYTKTKERTKGSSLFARYCTPISRNELKPGDLVMNPTHIAIYIGDGKTVEAANPDDGVKFSIVGNRFTNFGRLKGIDNMETDIPTSSAYRSDVEEAQAEKKASTQAKNTPTSISIGKFGNSRLDQYDNLIDKYSRIYGLNPNYMKALMRQESSMNANAKSGASAYGLMQITTWVFKHFNVPFRVEDALDPETNIKLGFAYAKDTLDAYQGNYEYMVQAYNCGISRFTAYLNGTKTLPTETKNHLKKINEHYTMLINNGGTAAAYKTDGSVDKISSSVSLSNTYTVKKKHGERGMEYTGDFGIPLYAPSPVNHLLKLEEQYATLSPAYLKAAEEWLDVKNEHIIERMTVDMIAYSNKGSLLRAFPTYVFLIVDENSDWMDGRKLWNNYYNYKSVVSIQIFDEEIQPVKTAVLTVTNMQNHLQKTPKEEVYKKNLGEDKAYNPFVRWLYKHTGLFIGTLKVTPQAVDVKNQLVHNMKLQAGARIHIRLGYGSNPAMLPVSFNGVVAEMSAGEVITMVAQSDGTELINNTISTKKDDINKLSNLQEEASDIIASLLTDKDNYLLNTLSKKWGEKSKYGIEHFGTSTVPTLNIGAKKKYEYDICKNIYLGKYTQQLYCANGAWFGLDGEKNIQMYLYNKTPWDVMQLVAQRTPEFICQPMYHQFETRLFFGLPMWNAKYRYDYDESSKKVYEYAKSFSQFHLIDSVGDIIDNQVVCSSKNLYTNCITMYTLSGNMKATPVLYSDKNIEWSRQKTKVIDSTILQDRLGWDELLRVFGVTQGKDNAIEVGISNLISSWEQVYNREIIMMGNPAIKSCDYAMINDIAGDMSGLCKVRTVVQSLSMETGFTTSVTPGMIAYSKLKNAGSPNFFSSLGVLGLTLGNAKVLRWAAIKIGSKFGKIAAIAKIAKGADTLKDIYGAIKTAKIIKNGKTVATNAINSIKAIKGVKTTFNTAKSITSFSALANGAPVVAGLAGGIPGIVAWIAVTILSNTILEAVIDYFSYNNCIGIRPLIHKQKYFVTGTKGQKSLIDGSRESMFETVIDDSAVDYSSEE